MLKLNKIIILFLIICFLIFYYFLTIKETMPQIDLGQELINYENDKRISIEKFNFKNIELTFAVREFLNQEITNFQKLKSLSTISKDDFYLQIIIDTTKSKKYNKIENTTVIVTEYSGGIHDNLEIKTWAYNSKEKKFLTLEQIIGTEKFQSLHSKIEEKLQQKDIVINDLIKSNIQANETNYANFLLHDSEVEIIFLPYLIKAEVFRIKISL